MKFPAFMRCISAKVLKENGNRGSVEYAVADMRVSVESTPDELAGFFKAISIRNAHAKKFDVTIIKPASDPTPAQKLVLA